MDKKTVDQVVRALARGREAGKKRGRKGSVLRRSMLLGKSGESQERLEREYGGGEEPARKRLDRDVEGFVLFLLDKIFMLFFFLTLTSLK